MGITNAGKKIGFEDIAHKIAIALLYLGLLLLLNMFLLDNGSIQASGIEDLKRGSLTKCNK